MELEKNIAVHASVKKEIFFSPQRLRRSHLRTLSPVRARNR